MADTPQAPAPAAIPTAATAQRLAAVVRPLTVAPSLIIGPGTEEADPGHDLGRDPARSLGRRKKSIDRTVKADATDR